MSGRIGALLPHLTAATLLRTSAEGAATAIVLTVAARTGRAADAGFLQTALLLPYVVSGPVIGHVLDRTSRPRAVAMALAAGYTVATALLFLMAGRTALVWALLVAAVAGCTEPIVVALTSLLPRYVPADLLSRAYGLEASSYSVAAIAGPGLAAAPAASAGGSGAGVAMVVTAVVGAAALAFLPVAARSSEPSREEPPPEEEPPPKERPQGARGLVDVVAGGLTVLLANPGLRALTAATTVGWLGFGGVAVTAVLFAEHIGEDADAGGRLLVAFAAGSLVGSLASSRWLKARHAHLVVSGGLVAFGTALAAAALAPTLLWALLCFLLVGVAEGPVFTATLMLRQRESPPDRLGQVNTTGGSLKIGASALGAALTGAFAGTVGPVGLLLAIAACQFAGAALGLPLLRSRPALPAPDTAE